MLAVLKRELAAYFTSPIGYVFLAVCFLTSGILFYLFTLSVGSTDLSSVFLFMFFIFMIFVPVLTMRLMADEKKQKTDQLILTSPISLFRIVMGKFLSAYSIYILGTAVMLVYGIVLSAFADVSWPAILGNWVGLALLGGIYVALGLLISALTENQMIAAVASIFLNFAMFLMNVIASIMPAQFLTDIVRSLSVYDHYVEFTLGIFSLSNVLFFLSVIFIFLFLTVRVMEKRRWA